MKPTKTPAPGVAEGDTQDTDSELESTYQAFADAANALPDTVKQKSEILSLIEKLTALIQEIKPDEAPESDRPQISGKQDAMSKFMGS